MVNISTYQSMDPRILREEVTTHENSDIREQHNLRMVYKRLLKKTTLNVIASNIKREPFKVWTLAFLPVSN